MAPRPQGAAPTPLSAPLLAVAGSGSPYPVTQQELDDLQATCIGPWSSIWRPRRKAISYAVACDILLSARPKIHKIPAYQYFVAFARLQYFSGAPRTWDYIVKVFNDLDTLLFHDQLRHRVTIVWKEFTEEDGLDSYAYCCDPGNAGDCRIQIVLNTRPEYSRLPRNCVLGVLVHKMIHAWFSVFCGRKREKGEVTYGHGPSWFRAARALEELTGFWILSRCQDDLAAPGDRGTGLFDDEVTKTPVVVPHFAMYPDFPELWTPRIPV